METFYSENYHSSDFNLWENGNIWLALKAGGFYLPEVNSQGLKIWLKSDSVISIPSRMNAVLGFYFNAFAPNPGTLTIKLGEQLLLSEKISQNSECRVYFAISPGENILSLNFSGPRYFEIFDPYSVNSRLLDFAIIKPEVKVISY